VLFYSDKVLFKHSGVNFGSKKNVPLLPKISFDSTLRVEFIIIEKERKR
jgi:hypothetical protein